MKFDLKDRVVAITGGAGLLGIKHAEAVAEIGGLPILIDIRGEEAVKKAKQLEKKYAVSFVGLGADIRREEEIIELRDEILSKHKTIDVLINNAANNPRMDESSQKEWSRLENFTVKAWEDDIAVGLTGAFLCSRIFGGVMAQRGSGVILNVASDLGIIAPDQRIYRQAGLSQEQQPVKPITYSVIKHGLIGLTRYLATYWCEKGIRVNALCPGGIYDGQAEDFVRQLTQLIPMGRMANLDEYKGAIQFLCSDASSYMTGTCLVMDGGRTCW
jgi:NAD(P)-dependent dehydrogenase (short-subunit alcohol dehydrogenase family)